MDLKKEKKRRVGIYMRVSTKEQEVEGYSIEAQTKNLKEYIEGNKRLGLEMSPKWTFIDTHTGSDLNREGLNKIRELVKAKKIDAVLIWKIDRLSRSLRHLLSIFEELEKHEVSLISMQENIDFSGPIGRLVFQIFGAIAQFERELIRGRTRMGKIASAQSGNFTRSAIPYGYRPIRKKNVKGTKIELLKEEVEWVAKIYDWYIYEGMGYGQIVNKLNELKVAKGQYTRGNKYSKWTIKGVRTILHSTIYRGDYIANKTDDNGKELPVDKWVITPVPPCVSEMVFYQAQAISKKRTGKSNTTYLLSGKIKDGSLDSKNGFVGVKRTKGGTSYRRKQFTDKDGVYYPVFEIVTKPLDDYVLSKVWEALEDPEMFFQHYASQDYRDPGRLDKLQHELSNLRLAKAKEGLSAMKVEDAYETGLYDEEKASKKLAKRNKNLADYDLKIKDIERQISFASSVELEIGKLKDAAAQFKFNLDNATLMQKKMLVDLFIEQVKMYRHKVGSQWNVRAEVEFRFNPKKLLESFYEVRTEKSQQKATKAASCTKNHQGGAGGQD